MFLNVARIPFAVVLVAFLASGAFFHAVFPHEHSHHGSHHDEHSHSNADEDEDSLWQSIHTALRGMEKKIFILPFSNLSLTHPDLEIKRALFSFRSTEPFGPLALREALKRGILQYRAFT